MKVNGHSGSTHCSWLALNGISRFTSVKTGCKVYRVQTSRGREATWDVVTLASLRVRCWLLSIILSGLGLDSLLLKRRRKAGGKLEDDAEARTSRTRLFPPVLGILPFRQTKPISTDYHGRLKRAVESRFGCRNEKRHQMDVELCHVCLADDESCYCDISCLHSLPYEIPLAVSQCLNEPCTYQSTYV